MTPLAPSAAARRLAPRFGFDPDRLENLGAFEGNVPHLVPQIAAAHYTEYAVSIGARCCQGCDYQPYES